MELVGGECGGVGVNGTECEHSGKKGRVADMLACPEKRVYLLVRGYKLPYRG